MCAIIKCDITIHRSKNYHEPLVKFFKRTCSMFLTIDLYGMEFAGGLLYLSSVDWKQTIFL